MTPITSTEETMQLIEESRAAREEMQRELITLQNRLNALEDLYDEVDADLDRLESMMLRGKASDVSAAGQEPAGGVTA